MPKTDLERRTMKPTANLFQGPDAIRDFLDPERHAPLPLVELSQNKIFNPFGAEKVRIFGCCGYLNPLLNTKALAVRNMLLEARTAGRLRDISTIVEGSSGNTAMSLGILAPLLAGVDRVVGVLPWDRAPGKGEMIRLLSVEERLTRGNAPEEARSMGAGENCFNPGQYSNPANPAAFKKWLAPNLWEQTGGALTVFCAALGTTGTVIGCSEYFRQTARPVRVVGVNVAAGQAVPGARTLKRLEEVSLPWQAALDGRAEAGAKESFWMSLKLIEKGILGGPSSGLALRGLHRFLDSWRREKGSFAGLQNGSGEVVAAVLFADTFFPYMEKYSRELEPEAFGGERSQVQEMGYWG
jgi:cysteine synthase